MTDCSLHCHCTIVNRHVTCLDVDVSTDMQKQNLSRATVFIASVPSLLLAIHMWPRHLCLDSGNFTWASKHVTQKKNQVFQGALFLVGSVLSILLATDISRHVAKAPMPPQQKLCLGLKAHYTKNQNHWSCASSSSSSESMLIFSKTYSALNNKLSCMNTLMKSAIIQVDTTPFCQWYESHVST